MNENVSKISPDTQHAGSHGTWHANRVIALCVFSKRTLCAVWEKASSISPDMAQVFGTGWVQLSVMSGGDGWSPRCARSCLGARRAGRQHGTGLGPPLPQRPVWAGGAGLGLKALLGHWGCWVVVGEEDTRSLGLPVLVWEEDSVWHNHLYIALFVVWSLWKVVMWGKKEKELSSHALIYSSVVLAWFFLLRPRR